MPEAFALLANYMDEKITANELKESPIFKKYDNSWVQLPTPAQKLAVRQQQEKI